MQFPPFEHAAWLARAWQDGPPAHDLGASGFRSPVLPSADVTPADMGHLDLHAGTTLRGRLADRAGIAPDRLRVTAGTSAANLAVLAALVSPGCNVVVERPTYLPMAAMAAGFGAEVRWVDHGDGLVDAMAAACDDDTAAILLTSPNNPTAEALDAAAFQRLGDAAAAVGAVVLADQVYAELTDHPVGAAVHDHVVTTTGMNKCWGAGGLRIGWAMGSEDVMARLEAVHRTLLLAPSTVGARLADRLLDQEVACRAALHANLGETHAVYRAWSEALGLDPVPLGLTAFPHVGGDTRTLAEAALADGILVLPGEFFGRPGHLRIGLGTDPAALAAALDALAPRLRAQRF